MVPIKTLIVENDAEDIKALETIIRRQQRFLNLSVSSIATNFDDAIDILHNHDFFHVSILDIELPDSRDCFDIIEMVERKKLGIITLHSKHEKYFKDIKVEVIQKLGAHLTLPKPYADKRYVTYAGEIKDELHRIFPEQFPRISGDGLYHIPEIGMPDRLLDDNDIYFVQANNTKSKFHILARNRQYTVIDSPLSLNAAEVMLNKNVFFRCHKSYLVNTANITGHVSGNSSGLLFFSNGLELDKTNLPGHTNQRTPSAKYSNEKKEELFYYLKKNHRVYFSQ